MVKSVFDLDMTPGRMLPLIINVSQYDDIGRTIVFNLYSSVGAWTAPTSAAVTFEGGKPDGKFFAYNCAYSSGTVTVTIQQQMTAVAGKVRCKAKVKSGDKVVESAPIIMVVDAAAVPDGSDMSKNDINDAIANATQKIVDQVKDNIPSDYSQLSTDVSSLKQKTVNLKTDTDEYIIKRIRGSATTSKALSLVLRYNCPINKGDKVSVKSKYDGNNIQTYDIRFYDISGNIHVIAIEVPIDKEYIFVAEKDYYEISLYTSITNPIEGKKFETVVSVDGVVLNDIHDLQVKQDVQNTELIDAKDRISNKYDKESVNILDVTNAIENKSINADTGAAVDNLTGYWLASDFLYLKPNTKYYCSGIFMKGIYAFYTDANENAFVKNPDKVKVYGDSSSNYTNGYIETGDSALYFRCSISTSQKDSAYISEFVNAYTPHRAMSLDDFIAMTAESNKLKDKKILVIGDSISTDYYGSYPKWVTVLMNQHYLPLDTINNSIHATGFVADAGTAGNDFLSRLKAVENKSSFDLVIVFGGINDYSLYKKEETISYTFTTAVDSFFEYLINNYVNARFGVIKPMLCNRPGGADDADKIRLYADYIANTAKKYAIPVLNMTDESGFNPFITQIYERWSLLPDGQELHDGIHPNEEFECKFMAPQISHFIDGLI